MNTLRYCLLLLIVVVGVSPANAFAFSYSEAVLADNPIGYWRLGEQSGSDALDLSGHDLHGTYRGNVILNQPGAILTDSNLSAQFDGSTGYVDVAPDDRLNKLRNNFTIEAWVRKSEGPLDGIIVSNKGSFGNGYALGIDSIIPRIHFVTFGKKDYLYPFSFSENQWTYIAVAFDSSNDAHFYVNGKFEKTVGGISPASINSNAFNIGRAPYIDSMGSYRHFPGGLDEVAIYGRSLSQEEIYEHYRAAIPESFASLILPVTFSSLRAMRGSVAMPGSVDITITTAGTVATDFTLSSSALTATPSVGTVAADATDPIPFSFGWSDTSTTGAKSGLISLTNVSNPDDLNNHEMNVSGAVLANRGLTVGEIGTAQQPVRIAVNAPLSAIIASGNDPVLDGDNHATRVNTVAEGVASDGNAAITYQDTPLSTFDGPSQNADLTVRFSQSGFASSSINLASGLLSDGEATAVGATVQPAMLEYNIDAVANRSLSVGAIGSGHSSRVMVNKPVSAVSTIASGNDPVLDDDYHATRINTVAGGTASDGYATVSYQSSPLSTFNGPNQSADLAVAFLGSSQVGAHQGSIDLAPTMLGDGEAASVGAAVQPATLNYSVDVLANRTLLADAVGTTQTPARVVVNCPRTTILASGNDLLLDSDEAATRVSTVAVGTATGHKMTVAYQGTPRTTFNGPGQSTDLGVTFTKTGAQQGSIDLAPTMLSDGEAASIGAVVQPATLSYNVNVLRPRRLRGTDRSVNFGNVLRGATVSDNFTVSSKTDSDRTTMVYVAPGGSSLGPLTIGQTLVSDRGKVSVPISGVLDTYMRGAVAGSLSVGTAEAPDVGDTTSYKSLNVRYRANVGIARLGDNSRAFNGDETVLSADVAAGDTMTHLSSKVVTKQGRMLADNPTPADWVTGRMSQLGNYLYKAVGSEAEIVTSTVLDADATVTMQWRRRRRDEANFPGTPTSPTLPEGGWLASDVVKIGGIEDDVNYTLQMSFDNRINLAFDGPMYGTVSEKFHSGQLYLAEFDDGANQWLNAGMGAGYFQSWTDFQADHVGTPLTDLLGSWGVDPVTSMTGLGHAWAIVSGSGIFAVDPGHSMSLSAHPAAVPEPSAFMLLFAAVASSMAYGLWRRA